jgi:hypothetical protein
MPLTWPARSTSRGRRWMPYGIQGSHRCEVCWVEPRNQYCGLIPCPRARFPMDLNEHLQDERVATVDSHNHSKTSRESSEGRIYPHPIAIGNFRISMPNCCERRMRRLT